MWGKNRRIPISSVFLTIAIFLFSSFGVMAFAQNEESDAAATEPQSDYEKIVEKLKSWHAAQGFSNDFYVYEVKQMSARNPRYAVARMTYHHNGIMGNSTDVFFERVNGDWYPSGLGSLPIRDNVDWGYDVVLPFWGTYFPIGVSLGTQRDRTAEERDIHYTVWYHDNKSWSYVPADLRYRGYYPHRISYIPRDVTWESGPWWIIGYEHYLFWTY